MSFHHHNGHNQTASAGALGGSGKQLNLGEHLCDSVHNGNGSAAAPPPPQRKLAVAQLEQRLRRVRRRAERAGAVDVVEDAVVRL